MNYNELTQKATALSREGCEIKFYEMVLSYGLMNLSDNVEDELISEEHFKALLEIMTDYLAECYRVAPWDVADAITMLIREHGITTFICNYNECGTMLEDKLCEM